VNLPFLCTSPAAVTCRREGAEAQGQASNRTGFQLIMNFLVMPIFFLSGALFPLDHLPPALSAITQADPLSYGIDGLRGTLIGLSHFGLLTDLVILVAVAAVLLSIGSYLFSRIEI
jgi:ABC-2 type transport system permease protein